MWLNITALPETCLLIVFEAVTQQNDIWEYKITLRKTCIFSAVQLHMNQNDICMLGMQNTIYKKKKKMNKINIFQCF